MAATSLPRQVPPASLSRAFGWAGGLLGFALGGFFDGILLHQILQWHHLLSAVEGEAFRDLRVQVLADGVFHALMYLVAIAGLWLLWRARGALAAPGAGRLLVANALLGFGLWHIVDGILSHWILGIHRIRMDSANPLLWDLIWFVAFGVLFVAAGWGLRRGSAPGTPGTRRPVAAASLLATAVLVAGPLAALPPPPGGPTIVLFKPGTGPEAALHAVVAAGGLALWSDASGELWAIKVGPETDATALYRHGALVVSRSTFGIGCLPWIVRAG
jgi:uncharacterized membrane protein